MNTKRLYNLVIVMLCFFSSNGSGQEPPKTSISGDEIREVLGVAKGEDFALVYKGDTLTSYVTNGNTAITTLFDEEIRTTNYGDSLGYEYNLPQKSGTYVISLPDSLPVYWHSYLKKSGKSVLIRYDSSGREKYREVSQNNQKVITQTLDEVTKITTVRDKRWFVKYVHSEPDSSYQESYTADSVLTGWRYEVEKASGERIRVHHRKSPYSYDYSKTLYDTDTNYTFSLNVDAKKDTLMSESFSREFKDLDSTYHCRDWSGVGYVAHRERFESRKMDSSYSVHSSDGIYTSVAKKMDSLEVTKLFDLQGNLLYRNNLKLRNGDYGVEEILERRDTFYHVVNYYHQLYWDKDHITDYFPYNKQVYLDQDSAVIRVLDYSFEKQDEWPVLTITEGDSNWVESTAEGGDSKYAINVAFCGGVVASIIELIIEDAPFTSAGAINRKTVKKLEEVIRGCAKYEVGTSGPPFYFFYSEDQGEVFTSFKRPQAPCTLEAERLLQRAKSQKALLYNRGTHEIDGCFFSLNFEHRFGERRDRPNR